MTIECPKCKTNNPDHSKFCNECATPFPGACGADLTKTLKKPSEGLAKGTAIAGKYKIIDILGKGGMGVVYKAEDTRLKRLVALKFLPLEVTRDEEAKKRFVREAQAAAALDHPNICTVHEIDEADDKFFISMSYIKGQSLKEKIASGALGLELSLHIAQQIADGLTEAHAHKIIHRDIKPANIMLTEKGQAKMMDFGIAKIDSREDLTQPAAVMGTVAYMSPEQERGRKVDPRTDIWSFGAVLYEMLTGRRFFESDEDQVAFDGLAKETPQPIAGVHIKILKELERIVKKCLEKNPDKRYQKANDILADLDSLQKKLNSEKKEQKPADKKPSIAVLSFVDMSPKKDQEYFCDGIAEELINVLTHIKDLRVVARTSAFVFKGEKFDVREIGEKLDVSTVLEGSIRKAGSRIRITAQLINVEDGYHLWSEKFDREMEDIFAIQDEISMAIVDHLKVKLLAREKSVMGKKPTDDLEAYNLYLKGLHFSCQPYEEAFKKSIDYFQKAIDKDPSFTLAYVGIGFTYGALGALSIYPPASVMPKAKAVLKKAQELDASMAEVQAHTAFIAFWYDWDWKLAEKSYQKSFELNPGYAMGHAQYAWFLLAMNRFDEAVREIKRAQELDPLLPLFYAMSVGIHRKVGEYDEAIEEFNKAVELDPDIGLAYFHLGTVYLDRGMTEKAISTFLKSKELVTGSGWAEGKLGSIYVLKGENEKAEQFLHEMIEKKRTTYVSSFTIASLCSLLGRIDETFEYLDTAYEEKDVLMPYLNVYTLSEFDKETYTDPRFKMLLKKMNL